MSFSFLYALNVFYPLGMTSLEGLQSWSPLVIYYVSKRGESCEAIRRTSDVGVSLYVICKIRFIVWSREHNTNTIRFL